jgi:hypothetical protein
MLPRPNHPGRVVGLRAVGRVGMAPLVMAAEPKLDDRFTADLAMVICSSIPWTVLRLVRGIAMADSKKDTYDSKKGGKFEPTTKAKPPPPPRPGHNK